MNGRMSTRRRVGRMRWAVLAATAAVVVPSAAAVPAGAADAGVGTVVQTGSTQTLVNESPTPAGLRFTATLPADATGMVNARLVLPSAQFAAGGDSEPPWLVAEQFSPSCSVNGGPLEQCTRRVPGDGTPDAGDIVFDLPTAVAAPTITYEIDLWVDSTFFFHSDQLLTGFVRVYSARADDSRDFAVGPMQLQYRYVPPPTNLTAMYGRDSAGVLWKYDGTGFSQRPFAPRRKVGPGWQIYTAITPLSQDSASGTGDVVARDRNGVLWYYRGTGDPAQPFARRVVVGSGWNIYTALMAGGDTTSGRHTLVARDSSGKLWQYEATGDMSRPFTTRVQIGHGWNIFSPLTGYGDGLAGRDASGVLWVYDRTNGSPTGPYRPRVMVGTGWNVYTALVGIKDATSDAEQRPDLVARDAAGKLWLYPSSLYPTRPGTRILVGSGWNTYNLIF